MERLEIGVRLEKHVDDLEKHFRDASDFLVKCQIIEPYVDRGILRGSVCPWEIGVADTHGFTILEDFHDTLEAMWVWCYYTEISGKDTYRQNIEMGWNYVDSNFERHIPPDKEDEGLYNCSHTILCGTLYEKVFRDNTYHELLETAGDRLACYLRRIGSEEESPDWTIESCWAWWMASCLGSVGQTLGKKKWLEAARTFVGRTVVEKEEPFCSIADEPRHRGPGGHECFSCSANKVLALLHCCPPQTTKEILLDRFLPVVPERFVNRHIDENAWNANVAMALGRRFLLTNQEEFLSSYFSIMDELKRRDLEKSSALPRSPEFAVRESWVTFFYAYAYVSAIAIQISGLFL